MSEQQYELVPLTETGDEAGNFGPYTWAEALAQLSANGGCVHGVLIRPVATAS